MLFHFLAITPTTGLSKVVKVVRIIKNTNGPISFLSMLNIFLKYNKLVHDIYS